MENARTLPQGDYDVAVIGAGIGGLTSAALLSLSGLKVCVLESDARPGGYLAGFRRKDFRFDSSIHWLNQLGPNGMVTRVFDLIGEDHPRPRTQQLIKRYKGDSFDYLLTDRPDDLKQQFIRDFPHDKEGIERFFRAAYKLGKSFEGLGSFFRSEESMSAFERVIQLSKKLRFALPFIPYISYNGEEGVERGLKKFFTDPKLRRVFASEMDILACLVPIGWAYFKDYQCPPEGGSQVMPEWLTHVVRSTGGEVHFKCRVTRVEVSNGSVSGVTFEHRGNTHTINCRQVVAACDVEMLYERLLPAGTVPAKMLNALKGAKLYPSSLTVSLALDVPVSHFGFGEEMVYVSSDAVPRSQQNSGDPGLSGITILAPSFRDPSMAPDGMGTLTLYIPAEMGHHRNWATDADADGNPVRNEAYEALKMQCAQTLIKRVEAVLAPGLSDHIVYIDVATPITHWRYTGNRGGTMMGARPGRENMQAKVAHYRTPVKGLVLGGHWAELGGGVPIAVKAGANAALLLLQDRKMPAAKALARYMDGKASVAETRKMGLMRSYAADWIQGPTPADAARIRKATTDRIATEGGS
jgi:prolycopene isomerase